ncbi:MAG: 2-hydroxyacyl-CoA dehydratase family protein [Desulfobacteraceae bacterium]|jgi:benzoyl-CoA reductase/2-hydroxyglutaryl-CoA dehydratase subunit BcrC/BadD/HgdB|nr:2-hydroxyacyl-CoA dehydratase family protein [Desulfobacteraceae bacterium]
MTKKEKIKRIKIKATGTLNQIMADYFYELDSASKTGEKKVAWCTSVGPAEILRAMGFLVFFPENHGAMLGASRMATDMLPIADAQGYSPDICSYLRADIGAYLNQTTPISKSYQGIEGVPQPDVLAFNTNQCRDVQDWFTWYAKKLDVPIVGIHTHRGLGKVTQNHIRSIAKQLEDMINPLEYISGKKLEIDELKRVVALSRECSILWEKVLNTARNVPSPFTFFDGTIHMAPAVVLRGTHQANDYYKLLLEELEERVVNNIAAVNDERHRIYWDGMPIWGRLRDHSELFSDLRANVLASTYCNSWIFSAFDLDDPFNSMARAYTELFIVRSDDYKETYLKKMLNSFKVDGIIYHDSKCCPNNSNARYGMPQRLEQQTGVPSLVINADLNDLRLVSDEQTNTNVEAFIEQLEENQS